METMKSEMKPVGKHTICTLRDPTRCQLPLLVWRACFRGLAANVKGLKNMCCGERSAWSENPRSEAFFHPDPPKTGSVRKIFLTLRFEQSDTSTQFNARGAHFLKEDVGPFDALSFDISLYEAKVVSPSRTLVRLSNALKAMDP